MIESKTILVYFKEYEVTYLMMPKCGSASIMGAMHPKFDKSKAEWHHWKNGDTLKYDFPVFTVVRNPINRFISIYNYYKKTKQMFLTVDEFLDLYDEGWPIQEAVPMTDLLDSIVNQAIPVDYIIMEDGDWVDEIKMKYDVNVEFPHKNKSGAEHENFLNADSMKRIQKIYQNDFIFYINLL